MPTPTANAVVNAINAQVAARAASVRASMASYNDTLSQLMMIKESVNSAKTSLNEMKSIAAQGASDSLSADVSRSLFERIDELRSDVNAIAATTSFNGQRLLDGSKARKTITTTQTVRNVASSVTPAAQNFADTSKAATTFTSIQGQRIEAAESLRVASGTGDSDEDILEATSLTAANSSSTSSQGTVASAAGNAAVSITGSTVAPVVPVAGYSTLAGVSSMRAGDTITGSVRNNLTSQVTNFSFTAPQGQSITSQASLASQFNASTAASAGVTASVSGSALRFTANAATSQIESVTASISRPTVTGTAATADDPVAAQAAAAGYSSLTAIDAQASNLLLNTGGTIKFQVDTGTQRTFTATQNFGAGGGSTTSKLNSLISAFNAQATGSAWGVTMTLTASGNRDQLRITANAGSSEVTSATALTAATGGITTTGTQTAKVAAISAQSGSTTISGLSSLAAADSLSVEVLDRAATGTGNNRPNVLQTITLTGTARANLSAIASALQAASGGSLTATLNGGDLVLTATTLTNDVRLGTVNIGATTYSGVDTPAIAEVKGASQLSDGTKSLTELQRGGTIAITIGGSTTTYTANTTLDQASIVTALASQLGASATVAQVNNVIGITATSTGSAASAQVTNPSYVDLNLGATQTLRKGDRIAIVQGSSTQTLTITGDRLSESTIRSEIETLLGANAAISVATNASGSGVRLVSSTTPISSATVTRTPQLDFSLGTDLKEGDQLVFNFSDGSTKKLVASQAVSNANLLAELQTPNGLFTDFSTNSTPDLSLIQALQSQTGSALIRSTDAAKTLSSITTARASQATFINATSTIYDGHLHQGDHIVVSVAGQTADVILTAKQFMAVSAIGTRINDTNYFESTNPALRFAAALDGTTLALRPEDASLGYSITKAEVHDFNSRHFVDLSLTNLENPDQLSVGDRIKVKQKEINGQGQTVASTEETLIVDTAISKANVVNAFRGNAPGNGKASYFVGTGANAGVNVTPTLATSHSGASDGRVFAKQSLSSTGNRIELEVTINEKGKAKLQGLSSAVPSDLVVLQVGNTNDSALYDAGSFSTRLSNLGASFDAITETITATTYDTAVDGYLQKPGRANKSASDLFDDTGLIRAGTRLSVTYTKTLGGTETKNFDLSQDVANLSDALALGLTQAIQPTTTAGQDLSVTVSSAGNQLEIAAATGYISDVVISFQSPTKATLGSVGDLEKGDRLTVTRAGVSRSFEASSSIAEGDLVNELNATTPSGKLIDLSSNAAASLASTFSGGLKASGPSSLVIAETALGNAVSASISKSPYADFSLTSAKPGDTFSVAVGGTTQSFTVLSDLNSTADMAAALNGMRAGALSGTLNGASASVTSTGALRIKSHSIGSNVAAERTSTTTSTVVIDGDNSQNEVSRLLSPTTFSDITIKSAADATANTDRDALIVGEVYDSIEVLKNSNTPSKEDFARLEAALDAQIEVLDQRIRGAELQAAAVQNLAQLELASARDSLGGQSVAAPSTQPLRILMLQNVSQALASQGNASRNVTLLLIQGLSSSFAGTTNTTQGILAVG